MAAHLPEMNQIVGSVSGVERKKGQKGGGGREREEMEGWREGKKKEERKGGKKESTKEELGENVYKINTF